MSFRSQDNSRFDPSWLRAHFAELALFCFAVSLLFIKLGIGEFEDWDESHIVFRAQVIERFGKWLDQSPHALGGLYSSSHPPLGIWLMVGSRALLGESEFATRLPAALCGLAAAVSMFYLLRRWCSDRKALLLSAAFAASSVFLWYSRHAQLDSLLMATSILSLTLYLESVDRKSNRLAIQAGLVFGLALLSKLGWPLYIIPFVVGYAYLKREWGLLRRFLIVGLTIGSTWYIYMAITNAAFLSSVFGWIVGLSSIEHFETGEKSPIYYLNQLILACPFLIAAVISLRRKGSSREYWLAFSWLALVMIVLQLAVTKFPHFALILLPPAFVMCAMTLQDVKRLTWPEWSALTLACLWSLSTQFRLLARGSEFVYLPPRWDVAIPLAIMLVMLVLVQLKRRSNSEAALTALTGLIVIVAATRVIGAPADLYDEGAKHIATTLLPRSSLTNLLVVHSGAPFDSLTPRLAYYTQGWTDDWLQERSSRKLAWTDTSLLLELQSSAPRISAVILERERDRFAAPIDQAMPNYRAAVSLLGQFYQHRDSLRSYDLFYN